ncbi:PREDICTED: uncharacterized protein LOC100633431 [Amphimedon queenslandica]|uniref:Death domain-containing protein n=1 Tax=Amphimedon queenslandica TaxID=400682 RepID=A0AAN0J812_AMPQE|nr:PREDICTED: uncharacterized protein LOC100633431 [Amphimedon queenslandica]XP_019852833.1 PREDICTED: uncharacterized protein LOC100633431 [Amphimedon queenslandica]XP_019852834.1 PREDICTED: uncharacterized protein LOC100633431 [Amphimedon queenslandica]XP_019852835.1 PREDICTED: uncharacterized protein LOC100633431 [Amphimedon queenslandica]|eukprot:XP_019852832.1 PREDICTED: uncharacterized protein LOC100633431 [Amphimedon queenslandica]
MAEPVHRPAILRLRGRTLDIKDLHEVIALLEKHHYNKASYHRLGLSLLLSHNKLTSIEQEHRGQVDRCLTECLASWLRKADGVENPTINTLITALRGIGENAVADGIDEEKQNDIAMPRNEISDRPLTSERHAVQQLDTVNPGVRNLELKIDRVSELQEIANKLQGKYDFLVLGVKKSLEDHQKIDVKDAKILIKECLKRKAHVVSELMPCIDILEKVNDFESFFEFLSKYDFIGYLNYKLLKKLSELVKDDDGIIQLLFEYEEEYAKLLNAASFQNLIPLFEKQSDLSPTAPLGLPYVSFRLEKPWFFTSVWSWVLTLGTFSWSYYALLKQLRENCVIITYAILPCFLDDVIRDLKNPLKLKKLKDKGVTVIELPQLEEESYLKSVAKKKLVSKVSLKQRVVPPVKKEVSIKSSSLASKASASQELSLKQGVPPIGKEVIIESSSLDRKLIRSMQSHTEPEEVISLLEAGANPNATEQSFGGTTALIIAIKNDNTDIVKLLLEKGADPNVTEYSSGGNPALILAIEDNNSNIVELLLEKGADPNVTEYASDCDTALIRAIEKNNIDIIKFLLEKGADPNIGSDTRKSRTPLFNAVKSGCIEVVDILLTNGAKTDVVDEVNNILLNFKKYAG